jgi:hypothetical protein
MDVSLHAVGGETRAQRRAAFQASQRLGSRIGDIGRNILEGLIYLSESDNFFEGPVAASAGIRSTAPSLSKWEDCRDCQPAEPAPKLDSLRANHHNFRRFPSGAHLLASSVFPRGWPLARSDGNDSVFTSMRHEPFA